MVKPSVKEDNIEKIEETKVSSTQNAAENNQEETISVHESSVEVKQEVKKQ